MTDKSIGLEEVEFEIRKALTQIADRDMSNVSAESSFRDLGLDSMMALEIMAAVEKKFNIQIQEEDLRKFTNIKSTMQALANYFR